MQNQPSSVDGVLNLCKVRPSCCRLTTTVAKASLRSRAQITSSNSRETPDAQVCGRAARLWVLRNTFLPTDYVHGETHCIPLASRKGAV